MALSVWQIIIVLLYLSQVVAFWKILPRAGVSKWLCILALLPLVGYILLLVVAFKEWPDDKSQGL